MRRMVREVELRTVVVVAVYTEPRGEMMCMFQGQQGGVTHLLFSRNGNQLLTGGRKVSIVIAN